MKILHVEDNVKFRDLVANDILKNHDIDGADDGSDGIRMFDQGEYDLVLLDYQMHEIHGPEVLKHIRLTNQNIPVIAMSMDDHLNKELMKLGASITVAKRDVDLLAKALIEFS